MTTAQSNEFRPIKGTGHAINREGVIVRIKPPARGGNGARCQFGSGYVIKGIRRRSPRYASERDGLVLLTQNGHKVRNSRRALVKQAFGQTFAGQWRRGEQVNTAKLTEGEVIEIRAWHQAGHSMARLAREYGVSEGTVWALCKRRTWRHLL